MNTVLVCGSRSWLNKTQIRSCLEFHDPQNTIVMHGGASGADTLAEEVCTELGLTTRVFHPDWNGLGKKAGIARNIKMLDEKPSLVYVFWDGVSKGTKFTLDEAMKRRLVVSVYNNYTEEK